MATLGRLFWVGSVGDNNSNANGNNNINNNNGRLVGIELTINNFGLRTLILFMILFLFCIF